MAEVEVPVAEAAQRPPTFSLNIASGMLESLGLNMYTSIGKSLSEFVANAYDADASGVFITIPFEEISAARQLLRDEAKAAVAAGKRDKFTVLVDPLPDTITIVIEDDGHGMSPEEVAAKLLVVSRNRRKESPVSESGARYVMGRKGLGKLAGFGTAEKVTIWSKRAGTTFATEFTMDYSLIEQGKLVADSTFQAKYFDDLHPDLKGTRITLSSLRCDSLRASELTVRNTLGQNFALLGETFKIWLNDGLVVEPPADYEFIYPPEAERDEKGFGTATVTVNDMLEFPIRYQVKFRARESEDNGEAKEPGEAALLRGHLPAAQRGARIYCNGRLAAGPTLLNLHSGMHNFNSQSYMECIVHADEVDRQAIDHIGTNRSELKGDSEIVENLRETVTELMRVALREHAKFREGVAEEQVDADDFSQGLLMQIDTLGRGIRTSSRRLLQTLAASAGVKSELYRTAAPLVLQSMNAGDVLIKLMELEHDPKSMPVLAHNLLELAKIENSDVLKLYRARRNGVEALRKLVQRARDNWKKGQRFENDLQLLLKDNPWLIKPEFSRYLTSDKPLGDVARQLTQLLAIDEQAPAPKIGDDGEISDQDNRPDLVFAMVDPQSPGVVSIVELKTPNYPLRNEHLTQLEEYMMNVEGWLASKFGNAVSVKGYLIGDIDPSHASASVKLLNKKFQESGPLQKWEIIPLPTLLERAKQMHADVILAAEKNEEYLDAELNTDPLPAMPKPVGA